MQDVRSSVDSALRRQKFTKKKPKTLPFYLKQGLPDQRFLDFRLFIHNRRVDEVQHDFKFFDRMMNPSNYKKKTRSSSKYREHLLYERKKNNYIKHFTNGSVDIETHKVEQPYNKIKEQFKGLKSSEADKLTKLMEKSMNMKKSKQGSNFTRPETSMSPGRSSSFTRPSTSFRQALNKSVL